MSFVSYESSPLNDSTLGGTQYLVADGYGRGHMFTDKQKAERDALLPQVMNHDEETVFYFRAEATNTANVPRYAWFKTPIPNAYIFNNEKNYTFDDQNGFIKYSDDRVYCVTKLNGELLTEEESAVLILPGETAVF